MKGGLFLLQAGQGAPRSQTVCAERDVDEEWGLVGSVFNTCSFSSKDMERHSRAVTTPGLLCAFPRCHQGAELAMSASVAGLHGAHIDSRLGADVISHDGTGVVSALNR